MRVLVTGGGGMLGQAVAPALEAAGHDVLLPARDVLDVRLPSSSLLPVLEAWGTDWVVHLAAFTRVDDCEGQPERAFEVNAEGARHVALAARDAGAGVLAISTDYVFDGRGTQPYREGDPVAPQSVYGRSKWEGEEAIRSVLPRHQIVRTSWLFGRGGPNFLDTILARARAGHGLKVVDDQRGSPTFTVDLAEALMRLLATDGTGTFHVTNTGDCTWYDLAAHTLRRAGLTVPLGRTDTAGFPRPAPRPMYSVLDNTRFVEVTGFRLPPWEDAVNRYLEASVPAA